MVEKKQREPNRAERRQMAKEKRLQKKHEFTPKVKLLISCPDCKSIDVKQIRHDYFKCNKCGAEHSISEMTCEF